jgi:hypothetical protein
MLYDPKQDKKKEEDVALRDDFKKNLKLFERWTRIKKFIFLNLKKQKQV